ncbi:Uu.00g017290.m01.CDS01 [Anthostomella pinea]|uniref:Uu.00g017290.m01.CDS01 n=1 Tax=Anthostomella pinea TaxID=933095 RepID=A0AAI8YQL2_9PEZI|nr:Uu.00g017290.m01.CDS01 [Anthostomella pinea]
MLEQANTLIFVFNMLPSSVQSRLPALQALRSASLSILSSRMRTVPIPGEKDTDEMVVASRKDSSIVEIQQMAPASLADRRVKGEAIDESTNNAAVALSGSGVKWRYAKQGSYMHHSASAEREDVVFSRKAYIDGLAYMLQALPDDLDEHESSVLRRALPEAVASPDEDATGATASQRQRALVAGPQTTPERSFLHHSVAGLVANIVLVAYLLLSVMMFLVRVGAQYERQHHLSRQLAARGLVLGARIYALSDGRVGRAMTDLAAWAVENVTGGIQDGIGQGLFMIERKRQEGEAHRK